MSVPQTRCLGLIGGLGPGATIYYYRELVAAHEAQQRAAHILISHADMNRTLGHVTKNDLDGLAQYLADHIKNMAAGGAEMAAIVAITPHICAPQLARISPLPLVDMVEEVANVLHARGVNRVALFGSRFTVESRMFGRLGTVEVIMPSPKEIGDIHELYFQILKDQRASAQTIAALNSLARVFIERDGAETILLAGTDLSLVFDASNTNFPAIDCARVHVDAIMRRLLS